MALFDGKLFDKVDRLVTRADHALDRVRKKPRKRLDVVPEPIEAPDPFTKPAEPAAAAPAAAKAAPKTPLQEAPLGDPSVAAQIFGRRTDMWSGRAVRLFQDLGIEARFIDLDQPEHLGVEMKLVRDTKQYEVPWVYLRGEFLGGFNALDELHRLGKLEERTLPPGERQAPRKSRVRIEAPPVPSEKPRSTGE